jgi:hypothetical protein
MWYLCALVVFLICFLMSCVFCVVYAAAMLLVQQDATIQDILFLLYFIKSETCFA